MLNADAITHYFNYAELSIGYNSRQNKNCGSVKCSKLKAVSNHFTILIFFYIIAFIYC
jgi:hypothetical protein